MLEYFSVKNFKNFQTELCLNLSDVKQYEFNTQCIRNKLIDKAIIYGVNGSGKSNLGFALFDIISHLTDRQRDSGFYSNYLYVGNSDLIAEFQYIFKFNNKKLIYKYGKKSYEDIIYEKIYIENEKVLNYDKRKSSIVEIHLRGAENLNKDLRNSKMSSVKYLLSNTVLENNETNFIVKEFANFVDKMLFFRSLGQNRYIGYEIGGHSINEDILARKHLGDFEKFLNSAGIKCKLSTIKENGKDIIALCIGNKKLNFFDVSSTGTQSLTLFYYWLQRLKDEKDVSLLFIDGFDAFYHYELSQQIVEELRDLPNQTIITTHNISLMTNDILRPDCYFILNKNQINQMANLTEKELRKAHNIEKMYKSGLFSGQ